MTICTDPQHQSAADPSDTLWTSWAAVFAGVATALALQIGLTELCLGLGLALHRPADPASSSASIAVGTIIAVLLCAVVSVFAGSWVAGRMKLHRTRGEAVIHGVLVWAVSGIGALLLTTVSIGVLAGGALSLLGQGLSGAATGLAAALPVAAQAAMPSWDTVKKTVEDEMAKPRGDAESASSDKRFVDQSRLMQLLGQAFSMSGKAQADAERQELTALLASQLGVSSESARATLTQWQRVHHESVERFATAKAEATRMASEAAGIAARRTSQAAFVAFIAMAIAAAAAVAGALCGSACAANCCRRDVPRLMTGPSA